MHKGAQRCTLIYLRPFLISEIISEVRTRDLKLRENSDYLSNGHMKPTAEDLVVAAQCRALHRIRKRQAAQQRKALANPTAPPPPAPTGGLKRGPKPNPDLEKSDHGLNAKLTKREKDAFQALRRRLAPHATPSVFLRWMICETLEMHRRKDCPTTPFGVDLFALDHRQKRSAGSARSAPRLAFT